MVYGLCSVKKFPEKHFYMMVNLIDVIFLNVRNIYKALVTFIAKIKYDSLIYNESSFKTLIILLVSKYKVYSLISCTNKNTKD